LQPFLKYIIKQHDKGSTTNNNLAANAKGISTTEVNTHCALKGKPTKHMLLATATVDVQNKSVQTPAVTTSRDTQHTFLL